MSQPRNWHLVNPFSHVRGKLDNGMTYAHYDDATCLDCGTVIPHGERFCADCIMRMELGDSEYQNRIDEKE